MQLRMKSAGLAAMVAASACQEARDPEEGRADAVERGRYLVAHVAACPDCHSPRRADGSFDPARWLSGVDCFVDVAPEAPGEGCLSTRNLTDHETGLANRTDAEIKDMFLRGVRPDGKALHPFMPYAFFGNMLDSDADAIVAYLRTVPGVDHTVTRSEPPFVAPSAPALRVPEAAIPMPRQDYPDREAALAGRYLAGNVGACLDCHTPRGKAGPDLARAFQGGLSFGRAALRLPAGFPETIYSANLTPHPTGILGYAPEQIVRALEQGLDRHGERLCPPMPAGPEQPFAGLAEEDALNIAHYLLSLPPAEHHVPHDCRVPEPDGGVEAIQ
jgi:mono/diheme cytochrome c family protein